MYNIAYVIVYGMVLYIIASSSVRELCAALWPGRKPSACRMLSWGPWGLVIILLIILMIITNNTKDNNTSTNDGNNNANTNTNTNTSTNTNTNTNKPLGRRRGGLERRARRDVHQLRGLVHLLMIHVWPFGYTFNSL